ncbi:hypothetical protein [Mycoplasmopsis pulmonis]|uniref:hypothetical protein n=1 Tax=Mycoplasmopsis pulmonis TaxID=2107 RepID=UPI002ACD9995|nr:hypothetical protein [Mycoplasmopsis pulmonis]MDZ7293773.1 hypothetical protein [Mycoplasmopsis pulmonis]
MPLFVPRHEKTFDLNNLHGKHSGIQPLMLLLEERDPFGGGWGGGGGGYRPPKKSTSSNTNNNQNNTQNNSDVDIQSLNDLKAEFNNIKINFDESLKKSKNLLYHLESYLIGLKVFNGLSAALSAASWALFLWYSAQSILTFGASTPLAVAVGIQSGIITYFTNEGFNTQYEVEKQIKEIKEKLNSYELNKVKENFEKGFDNWYENLMEFKRDIFASPSGIGRIINVVSPFSPVRISLFNLLPKALSEKITNLIAQKTFKNNFLINIVKKFSTNLTSKRAVLIGTTWASPIGTIISALDAVVGATSLIFDIAYNDIIK